MTEENGEIKDLRTNLMAACNMAQKELMALQELIINPEKTEIEILETLKHTTVGGAVATYLIVAEKAHRMLELLEKTENSNYEIRVK